MSLKDRLIELIDNEGLNPNQFYSKTGLGNGFLNTVGETLRKPSIERIEKAFPKWNIKWILTGEGEKYNMHINSDLAGVPQSKPFKYLYSVKNFFKDYYSYLDYNIIEQTILEKQLTELTNDEISIISKCMNLNYDDLKFGVKLLTNNRPTGKLVPIYDSSAAAGNGNVELSGVREGWINVGDLLKDSEGSLYVYGNSMIPGYPPGSLICFRSLNESFIEPGSVYIVQTESNRYIKRLYYNSDKSSLICISDNHIKHTDGPMEGEYLYPPFEIPFSAIQLIYKVTGVIKRNSISSH